MAKLAWSTANTQITNELINVASSAAFNLDHDVFYGDKAGKVLTIYTGASATGTQLTVDTDYTIAGAIADASLPASIDPDVAYTTVAITNASYHDTDLYVAYYPLGDYIEPGDFKENQGTCTKWNTNETSAYEDAGVIVERGLMHFASSGKTGNSGKDPLNQANLAYWVPSPGLQTLIARTKEVSMSLHPALDRASGDFQNVMKIDELALDGTTYEFWQIALDGSTVTGDPDLVAAWDIGGANEHPLADILCPDSLGTRTTIDMGEYALVAQSDSGESDTLGEAQADRMQGHLHNFKYRGNEGIAGTTGTQDYMYNTSGGGGASGGHITTLGVQEPKDDGTNGTPRTGTTTRGKQLVNGAAYIISMIPA